MAIKVNTRTLPQNLRQKWNFALRVNGFNSATFQKADRPKAEFEAVEFDPAGSHRTEKLPGRVKFDDLNFEKGVVADGADREAIDWMQQALDFVSGMGSANPADFLRDVELVEYDRAGDEVDRWVLHGAFVQKYDGGDLDGSASENTIETLTISYQYFSR